MVYDKHSPTSREEKRDQFIDDNQDGLLDQFIESHPKLVRRLLIDHEQYLDWLGDQADSAEAEARAENAEHLREQKKEGVE